VTGRSQATRRIVRSGRWIGLAAGGLALLIGAAAPAQERLELADVELAPRVRLADTDLVLNGAGIRKKFFVKVYVGALYLPQRASDAAAVLAMQGPKRVLMHFLYKQVEADKLIDGWNEGFEKNQAAGDLERLRPRLARFNALFSDVRAGDEILLDYLPGQGTRVTIRGDDKGLIPGEDFHRALLAVWLGDEPADAGLKKGMLRG
jgi:hypothetical protein